MKIHQKRNEIDDIPIRVAGTYNSHKSKHWCGLDFTVAAWALKILSFLGSLINSLTDYNLFRKQTDRIFKTAFKIFSEIKIIFKIHILRKNIGLT